MKEIPEEVKKAACEMFLESQGDADFEDLIKKAENAYFWATEWVHE